MAAAVLNSTRSYTTPYLKQWFSECQIDTLHGAASILMIGSATCYARLSLKTHFATLVFFTGLHIVTNKITSNLFRNQLALEVRNRHRQKSTLQNVGYLSTELFPEKQGFGKGNATAYLYAMPEGFFVFLSQSGGLPFFPDRSGSIDASGIYEIQEKICGTLELSPEALQRLQEQVKKVSFDRAPTDWELEEIPPFVCFEGKWNAEHNPLGTAVNWENLILKGLSQRHEAFALRPLAATWTTHSQTPGLRGFRFSHTDSRFSIWVHEKNVGALENEKNSLVEEVRDFRAMLKFLRKFENAAYAFLPTMTLPASPQRVINWDTIGHWFNLIINNPFSHLFPDLTERYRPLQHLIHQQNATEEQKLELIPFAKIKCIIYAEIFKEKLHLEIEANHLLVSEIESPVFTEKNKLNSPLYFSRMV